MVGVNDVTLLNGASFITQMDHVVAAVVLGGGNASAAPPVNITVFGKRYSLSINVTLPSLTVSHRSLPPQAVEKHDLAVFRAPGNPCQVSTRFVLPSKLRNSTQNL